MKIKRLFSLTVFVVILAGSSFALERIVDNAGILSAAQKGHLENYAASVAMIYNFDLVIVTERSIGNMNPMVYADNFFDYNGYGQNGCLFLQVTGSRDYWFSTSGRGIEILNSTAEGKLETDTVKFLRESNYYEAYMAFLKNWELFLSLNAQGGRTYNFFYRWNLVLVAAAWLIALAIGFIIVQVWKAGMNTAIPQRAAAAYVIPGSLVFRVKKDSFLYSTVSKVRRQTQTTSSGGGGMHTGSSGRSHGGFGGKY